MAMDSFGNFWVAEHTINKIGVIDPQTGTNKEIKIPSPNPFVQWITSDSKGQIWFAEQRGNSLGVITANVSLQSNVVAGVQKADNSNSNPTNQPNSNNPIPKLGFSYTDIVGPSLASGIIISALFYAKSVVDLKKSVVQARNRKS
jgi:copper transport protein